MRNAPRNTFTYNRIQALQMPRKMERDAIAHQWSRHLATAKRLTFYFMAAELLMGKHYEQNMQFHLLDEMNSWITGDRNP